MSRAIIIGDFTVIMRTLVGIFYHKGNRSTGSLSFKDTGKNFHAVCLLSMAVNGTVLVPAVKISLNILFTKRKSGRASVYHNTDAFSMRFSPGCKFLNRFPNVEPNIVYTSFSFVLLVDGFPASGSSTWKHQPAFGNRKTDFL